MRQRYLAFLLLLSGACSDRDPVAATLSQDEPVAADADVGGFAYEIVACRRTKSVSSAPEGYEATWTETVETIEAANPDDADFARLMREEAARLSREYYQHFDNEAPFERASFETHDHAGSMDVTQDVVAASNDLVSVRLGTAYYEAGMAHPQSEGGGTLMWSRRLRRPLAQDDVFVRPPDRALRRIALARFDNSENLQNPDDPDGIPLRWERASIGPAGITWWFDPYELGGYLSAGSATIGWRALKPYLRDDLPFAIDAIREVSHAARTSSC